MNKNKQNISEEVQREISKAINVAQIGLFNFVNKLQKNITREISNNIKREFTNYTNNLKRTKIPIFKDDFTNQFWD